MSASRRRTVYVVLAALLGFAATVLPGCSDGGSERGKLLGPERAAQLRASLNSVEQMADAGDCDGAAAQADALGEQVNSLPDSVDSNLRDALASGTNRLRTLVERRCTAPEPTAPTTEPPAVPPEDEPADEQGKKKGSEDQQDSGQGGENPGKGKAKGLEKKQPQEDQSSQPDTGGVTP